MTDYADLVKRLKVPWGGKRLMHSDPEDVSSLVSDAIDAIEALVKELYEAREDEKASGKAYDEVLETKDAMRHELQAAEAKAAKLKEALNTICETEDALIKANPLVNSQWQQGMNDAWLSAASIARRALEEGK